MNYYDRQVVRSTWAGVVTAAGAAERAAAHFYDRLFTLDPSLRLLFLGADLAAHGRALMHAVGVAVANLERLEGVVARLDALSAPPGLVDDALLWAVERVLGPACTPTVRAAWSACCALLTGSQRVPNVTADATRAA